MHGGKTIKMIWDYVVINLPLYCGEVGESEEGLWGRDGEHKRYIDYQSLWDVTLWLWTLGVCFPTFWENIRSIFKGLKVHEECIRQIYIFWLRYPYKLICSRHMWEKNMRMNFILIKRTRAHLIDIDIFVNCNWVDNLWQLYSTHLHTNSTQNDTKQTIRRTTQK
jgi:hypothetical protein